MNREHRIKRLRFRAWHRGTKEADIMIGGFFDKHHEQWSEAEIDWFEWLLEEQDVDIMAWALGTLAAPDAYAGEMLSRLKIVNYIEHPE